MLFFKNKEKSEEDLIEEELSDLEDDLPVSKKELPKKSTSSEADIERIKAQIDALNEMRKTYSERFTRFSEQIGELRNMLIEKEKDIRTIETQAVKASELVEAVQPEKLLLEIKKEDVKIESIKSKIESYEIIAGKIREELMEVRNKISSFRGIEETIQMNKEVREDIEKLRKMESSIEIHADKVESIFGAVEKRFNDFKKYEDLGNNLNDSVKSLSKELNETKVKATQATSKDEFTELKNEVNKKLMYFDKLIGELKEIVTDIQGNNTLLVEKISESEPAKINDRLSNAVLKDQYIEDLDHIKENIRKIINFQKKQVGAESEALDSLKDEIDSKIEQRLKTIKSEIILEINKSNKSKIDAVDAAETDKTGEIAGTKTNSIKQETAKELNKLTELVKRQKSNQKTDTSKITKLIEYAKQAIKNKNTDEVKKTYLLMKDEYEALNQDKKEDVYDDVKRIYDWVICS